MFQSANVSSDFSSKKSWSPMTQSSFATRFLRQPVRPPVADRLRPPELAVRRSAPQVTFCVRGVISPLLANVYLHYSLDLWAERWRRREATGDMIIVRYADDGAPRRREEEANLPREVPRLCRGGSRSLTFKAV